jgi:hypothetical protein
MHQLAVRQQAPRNQGLGHRKQLAGRQAPVNARKKRQPSGATTKRHQVMRNEHHHSPSVSAAFCG